MKIVIVGPGAIGCLIAAFLSRVKQAEVWLLDKDLARARRINKSGVFVQGINGKLKARVKITACASQIKFCDLIIFCVKSYAAESALKTVKPLLNRNVCLLSLQNGLGNVEIISKISGNTNVWAGVIFLGATLLSEANVRYAGAGKIIIGKKDGKITRRMRVLRDVFKNAGFEISLSKKIDAWIWHKLIINIGINALSAITSLKNGDLLKYSEVRQILDLSVREAVCVAEKMGIKLIYKNMRKKTEAVCDFTAENISSMLQDVLNRKKTEIDSLNGAIVRKAEEIGIDTPVNRVLTNLIKIKQLCYTQT